MKKTLSTLLLVIVIIFSVATAKAGNIQNAIQPLFKTYEAMVSSLVNSSPENVQKQAMTLQKQIKEVDESKLTANELAVWKKATVRMMEGDKIIINSKSANLMIQRRAFNIISQAFFNIMIAGIPNTVVYYYHSKKAVHGTGAYWLTDEKGGANPYLGTKQDKSDVALKAIIK